VKITAIPLLDGCANRECSNSLGEGRFEHVTLTTGSVIPDGHCIELVLCSPCVYSLRHIAGFEEVVAETIEVAR